jgi:hypothetical protein
MSNIYTTVSEGRTHIALGPQYLGSVNSYNNPLTQCAARILGWSLEVDFDGKLRSLDKNSYTTLVKNLTKISEIDNISNYTLFRTNVLDCPTFQLPKNNIRMRDVILQEDSQNLFIKLTLAIFERNTQRALFLIGKGAALDRYVTRDYFQDNISAFRYHTGRSGSENQSTKLTPIHLATIMKNDVIIDCLKEFGANKKLRAFVLTYNNTTQRTSRKEYFLNEETNKLEEFCSSNEEEDIEVEPLIAVAVPTIPTAQVVSQQ